MQTCGITAAQPAQDMGRVKAFYIEKVGLQAVESHEVLGIARATPVESSGRREDHAGVVIVSSDPRTNDTVEVLGVLGDDRPVIGACVSEELLVGRGFPRLPPKAGRIEKRGALSHRNPWKSTATTVPSGETQWTIMSRWR